MSGNNFVGAGSRSAGSAFSLVSSGQSLTRNTASDRDAGAMKSALLGGGGSSLMKSSLAWTAAVSRQLGQNGSGSQDDPWQQNATDVVVDDVEPEGEGGRKRSTGRGGQVDWGDGGDSYESDDLEAGSEVELLADLGLDEAEAEAEANASEAGSDVFDADSPLKDAYISGNQRDGSGAGGDEKATAEESRSEPDADADAASDLKTTKPKQLSLTLSSLDQASARGLGLMSDGQSSDAFAESATQMPFLADGETLELSKLDTASFASSDIEGTDAESSEGDVDAAGSEQSSESSSSKSSSPDSFKLPVSSSYDSENSSSKFEPPVEADFEPTSDELGRDIALPEDLALDSVALDEATVESLELDDIDSDNLDSDSLESASDVGDDSGSTEDASSSSSSSTQSAGASKTKENTGRSGGNVDSADGLVRAPGGAVGSLNDPSDAPTEAESERANMLTTASSTDKGIAAFSASAFSSGLQSSLASVAGNLKEMLQGQSDQGTAAPAEVPAPLVQSSSTEALSDSDGASAAQSPATSEIAEQPAAAQAGQDTSVSGRGGLPGGTGESNSPIPQQQPAATSTTSAAPTTPTAATNLTTGISGIGNAVQAQAKAMASALKQAMANVNEGASDVTAPSGGTTDAVVDVSAGGPADAPTDPLPQNSVQAQTTQTAQTTQPAQAPPLAVSTSSTSALSTASAAQSPAPGVSSNSVSAGVASINGAIQSQMSAIAQAVKDAVAKAESGNSASAPSAEGASAVAGSPASTTTSATTAPATTASVNTSSQPAVSDSVANATTSAFSTPGGATNSVTNTVTNSVTNTPASPMNTATSAATLDAPAAPLPSSGADSVSETAPPPTTSPATSANTTPAAPTDTNTAPTASSTATASNSGLTTADSGGGSQGSFITNTVQKQINLALNAVKEAIKQAESQNGEGSQAQTTVPGATDGTSGNSSSGTNTSTVPTTLPNTSPGANTKPFIGEGRAPADATNTSGTNTSGTNSATEPAFVQQTGGTNSAPSGTTSTVTGPAAPPPATTSGSEVGASPANTNNMQTSAFGTPGGAQTSVANPPASPSQPPATSSPPISQPGGNTPAVMPTPAVPGNTPATGANSPIQNPPTLAVMPREPSLPVSQPGGSAPTVTPAPSIPGGTPATGANPPTLTPPNQAVQPGSPGMNNDAVTPRAPSLPVSQPGGSAPTVTPAPAIPGGAPATGANPPTLTPPNQAVQPGSPGMNNDAVTPRAPSLPVSQPGGSAPTVTPAPAAPGGAPATGANPPTLTPPNQAVQPGSPGMNNDAVTPRAPSLPVSQPGGSASTVTPAPATPGGAPATGANPPTLTPPNQAVQPGSPGMNNDVVTPRAPSLPVSQPAAGAATVTPAPSTAAPTVTSTTTVPNTTAQGNTAPNNSVPNNSVPNSSAPNTSASSSAPTLVTTTSTAPQSVPTLNQSQPTPATDVKQPPAIPLSPNVQNARQTPAIVQPQQSTVPQPATSQPQLGGQTAQPMPSEALRQNGLETNVQRVNQSSGEQSVMANADSEVADAQHAKAVESPQEMAGRKVNNEGAPIAEQRMINGLPFNVYMRRMAARAQAMKALREGASPAEVGKILTDAELGDDQELPSINAKEMGATDIERDLMEGRAMLGKQTDDAALEDAAKADGDASVENTDDGAQQKTLSPEESSNDALEDLEAGDAETASRMQASDAAAVEVEGLDTQGGLSPELAKALAQMSKSKGGGVELGQRFAQLQEGDSVDLSLDALTALAEPSEADNVTEVEQQASSEKSVNLKPNEQSAEHQNSGDGMKVNTTLGDVILGNVMTDNAQRAVMVDNKNFSTEISRLVSTVETLFYQAEGMEGEGGGTALEEGVSLQLRGERFKNIGDSTLKCHMEDGKLVVEFECAEHFGAEYLSKHHGKLVAELSKRFQDTEIMLMVNGLEVAEAENAGANAEVSEAMLQSDAGGTSGGNAESSMMDLLEDTGEDDKRTNKSKDGVGSGLFGRVSRGADADTKG